MEVITQLASVGQGLDNAVHEAGVPEIDQSCESRQTHHLLFHLLEVLAAHWRVAHWGHHAGRLGLETTRHAQGEQVCQIIV